MIKKDTNRVVVYIWELFMSESCLYLSVVYISELFMSESCLYLSVVYI
jgi:hypothetical protein